MEVYNGKISVTFAEMTEGDWAVMSPNTLGCILRRHPELRLSGGGGMGRVCRIDYYGLRESYRRRFEAQHGDPREVLATEALKAELALEMDERARQWYSDYRYEKRGELVALPEAVIDELTINASVLNRMIEITNRRSVMRANKGMKVSGKELLESAGEMYEKLRDVYDHTLPTSLERLRSKMTTYRRDGYGALISGKWGNSSATVITDECGDYLIALKRSRVPVYTDAMIFESFNCYAKANNIRPLRSLRAVTDWLNRPENKVRWYDAAHGELAAHQRFSRKHDTGMPKMRDSLWYGDGTKLNLYYKEWVKNDKGGGKWEIRTLQVYEVIDAYSEMLLGYHISETENYEAQYAAYRMAVAVSGHRPYEIVHDNQGGHNKLVSTNFLNRLPSGLNRPTAPNSGQSKAIENLFGRFQNEYLRRDWRFTGMNITAGKESSRVNLDFIDKNKELLYTRDELMEAYAEMRKVWNAAPHHKTGIAREEMYRSSSNPAAPAVSERDMVEIFWLLAERPVAYSNMGLSLTVKKHTYHYEVCGEDGMPDHRFYWENNSRKFRVKYDPCDMRSVRLYSEDANGLRFERVAVSKRVVQRNIQEQGEGDMAFIRAMADADVAYRKQLHVESRVLERKYGTSPEQHGLKSPGLAGVRAEVREEAERDVAQRSRRLRASYGSMSAARVGKEISLAVLNPETGRLESDPLGGESEERGYSEYKTAAKF